jgi:hypothetical protein
MRTGAKGRQHRRREDSFSYSLAGPIAGIVIAGGLAFAPGSAQAVECANGGVGPNPAGDDTGDGLSTACGNSATASGDFSAAYGVLSTASGASSSAYGDGSRASGTSSSAYGVLSTASGANDNTVVGSNAGSSVSGSNNVAIGSNAGNSVGGSNNFHAGAFSGLNTTGSDNVAIGQFDRWKSPDFSLLGCGPYPTDQEEMPVTRLFTLLSARAWGRLLAWEHPHVAPPGWLRARTSGGNHV